MKEPTGGRLVNLFGDLFDRFVALGLRPPIYTTTWASTLVVGMKRTSLVIETTFD